MNTVGLLFKGDSRKRSAWSGVPSSLAGALEGLGVGVKHVSAEPGGRLGSRWRDRLGAQSGDGIRSAKRASAALAGRLRRAGELDALIQLGTEYVAPAEGPPLATYEDMTVAQARKLDHPLLRGRDEAELDAWVERQAAAYRRAVACCVMTNWVKDSVVADYGVPESRVHVVGLGRNLDPKPVERDWSRPRFLFMGQDWERKSGPSVITAFREVRARVPEAELTLLGDIPPLDVPGATVHPPLFLNDPKQRRGMEQLYESATCLVLPSLIEPGAIVHLESATAGVPSIGTTVGGVRDLIGDTGRLVDPHDQDALVRAMLELADGELARRLGAAARERVSWYTWPQTAARIAATLGIDAGSDG